MNKKKQKDFFMLGHGRCRRHSLRPSIKEVFAPFFQKAAAFFFPRSRRVIRGVTSIRLFGGFYQLMVVKLLETFAI
ncbi:MAG: hypothetical protein WCD70_11630 [Alphaproteobacteria bacterium]